MENKSKAGGKRNGAGRKPKAEEIAFRPKPRPASVLPRLRWQVRRV